MDAEKNSGKKKKKKERKPFLHKLNRFANKKTFLDCHEKKKGKKEEKKWDKGLNKLYLSPR